MCLSVPGRVLQVRGRRAEVSSGGWIHEVDVSHIEVGEGDYVLVHGGVALMVLNAEEAEEALAGWKAVVEDA
jgi:hydrogenase assembly chaperone HypC/HupF